MSGFIGTALPRTPVPGQTILWQGSTQPEPVAASVALPVQQDLSGPPLANEPAAGNDPLDVAQRSAAIGEPIPVVFCRRQGNVGGVLLSPPATEARFENDATNAVTAYYHLVLGEGRMDAVQVRDTFQRSCRVGTLQQTYNRRAGTWGPGNFITAIPGFTKPEAPYYCGLGGSYAGLTTASFQITAPNGDTRWNRQVHLFMRGGLYVTRLLDSVEGPSSNLADLILYLARRTSKVPEALLDTDLFTSAAEFVDAMGFACDIRLDESQSLDDFIASVGRWFLLTKSRRGGKVGLRPMLPVNGSNVLSTDPVTPVTLFDESRVLLDSFELTMISPADRRPFCAVMLWRQQPDNDIGLVRSTEVRYRGTAIDGPFEQFDLSAFCTSELHAVRVGAFEVARRRHVTHTLRVRVRPGAYAPTLSRGDVVQVKLQRTTSIGAPGVWDYLYQVDKIGKPRGGQLDLDLIHFPVDALGRSLVALDVMAATAGGELLPTGLNALGTCDTNSSLDTTPAADVGQEGTTWGDRVAGGGGGGAAGGDPVGMGGLTYEAAFNPGISASVETLDAQENATTIPAGLNVGDAVPAPTIAAINSALAGLPPSRAFWEIKTPTYANAQWTVVVNCPGVTVTVTVSGGGSVEDRWGGGSFTFTQTGTAFTLLSAYGTTESPFATFCYGIFRGNSVDAGLFLDGSLPGLGTVGGQQGQRGGLVSSPGSTGTVAYTSGSRFIQLVSMTRLS